MHAIGGPGALGLARAFEGWRATGLAIGGPGEPRGWRAIRCRGRDRQPPIAPARAELAQKAVGAM